MAYFLAPHIQNVILPISLSIASSQRESPIPFLSHIYYLAQVCIARVAPFKHNGLSWSFNKKWRIYSLKATGALTFAAEPKLKTALNLPRSPMCAYKHARSFTGLIYPDGFNLNFISELNLMLPCESIMGGRYPFCLSAKELYSYEDRNLYHTIIYGDYSD